MYYPKYIDEIWNQCHLVEIIRRYERTCANLLKYQTTGMPFWAYVMNFETFYRFLIISKLHKSKNPPVNHKSKHAQG